MIRAIIFDGDDTLWQTEQLYDHARADARREVEAAGLDGDEWERRERLIDVENVARFGHSVQRFPTSCAEAYERLCEDVGQAISIAVRTAVYEAAKSVFSRRAPLVRNAAGILKSLRERGYVLALLTKGDPSVQRCRIEQSGLAHLFDLIEVVDHKTPETIASVLDRLGVPPSAALTVGNSVRSDVLPSLEAGVAPIWVDAHVWEYEREHKGPPVKGVIKKEELSGILEMV